MNPGRCDVAIVGAGIVGAWTAFWLKRRDPRLDVLLVERDPSFARASSARSASSIRQQFSHAVNIRMSQFGVACLRDAATLLAVDGDAPPAIGWHEGGYLYLAGDALGADALRARHRVQAACDADIRLLTPDALAARFPWLHTGDLALGAFGASGEGWFDGPALHAAVLRKARSLGARWRVGEVTGVTFASPSRVAGLRLADGADVHCGHLVNAAGPWARSLAALAGVALPVRARRRTVFVLSCERPPAGCPLLIDPTGFWLRPEGRHFLFGRTPDTDDDDLPLDPQLQELDETTWATLAARVPAFEALRVERAWAGYYEMNPFDHNAIVGPHPVIGNLLLANGFSGHGMQQAAAAGRGLAEVVVDGGYRSLDLGELGLERVLADRPLVEDCVIG